MPPERVDDGTVLLVGASGDGVGNDHGDEAESGREEQSVGTASDATAHTPPPLAQTLESTPYRVRTVDGAAPALEVLETSVIDCVVVDGARSSTSTVDLTREIGDRFPTVPVLYCSDGEGGPESPTSEVIAAGVTRYVPAEARADGFLTASLEQAITDSRRQRQNRDRARLFDAIFEDPHSYTWVLDPDGTVVHVNDAARSVFAPLEADEDTPPHDEPSLRGRTFWELPGWVDDARSRAAVQDAIERAADGVVDHRELQTRAIDDDGTDTRRTLEVTTRPVRDDGGEVVSLVADATDVTERARLETELRESEELHRVTLNNMTDTVLITDDEGAFTYVCPNVHFIFGYTDDEIHEMGTIDELLGTDLFDQAALESEGVLTNLECTATDRAGEEHTLLVNVREVSIQEGTLLYSCRDVTKRKEREEALTALQRTARRLLYAETKQEIGGIVVEDAPDVLSVEASAAFVFDTDENVLRPVATAAAMDRLHGPFPPFRASTDSLVGHCYVEGEPLFFDDVHDADELANRATEIRSGAFVPLGDHGVFVAGSADVGRFDDVTREIADLLAATAEAALDRVERETTLREQERELTRQNHQLTRLNRINEIIREIDQVLVRAETRAEIERAVCAQLTASDRFRLAWIGEPDPASDALTSRAWDGDDRGYLDSVAFPVDGDEPDHLEPASRTMSTQSVTVVSNVVDRLREAPWRKEALSRDYQSVISVPLAYDEFTYGVLTVYADRPGAFDGVSRDVFAELGETIASAMGALERKNALLTTSSTRLELEIDDPNFVFHRLATRAGCTVSFSGGVQQTATGASVFASIDGAAIEDVVAVANDLVSVERVQVITDDGERGGTIRLDLSQPFLALRLADHGVVLRRVEATPSGTHVVIDVPSTVDSRRSIEVLENAFTDVTLVSKTTVEEASARDLHSALLERLTDRQLEVVQVAYYGGFFEEPRERTGEEVAETLGISPAAFYRHVRTVQRNLFTALFDDVGLHTSLPAEPRGGRGVE